MSKPSESELNFAAEEYVFDKNGHKFSNNNDEAGDNFASFLAGANWVIDTHTQTNEWKSAAMKLGEKLSPNGPDDYYGFTADQWLQWSEESVKKLNTTKEDIDDIKAIALEIQQMAAKANYSDNTFAEFAYDVDQAMRAILEIIEKPKFSIIKVISREETK